MNYPYPDRLAGNGPEQGVQTLEPNLLLAHRHELTPDIVTAEYERVIAEAEDMLRRAAGETGPTDGQVQGGEAGAETEARIDPLTGLSSTFNTLGLELGHDTGITFWLIKDVHPDEAVREAAAQRQDEVQAFSDAIFTDPKYDNLFQAFQAMDRSAMDEEDAQRYDYYQARFAAARPEASADATPGTNEQVAELRGQVSAASKEFLDNNTKIASLSLSQAEFESLPLHIREQLKAVASGETVEVQLSKPALDQILENGERAIRRRAYETFHGERVAENDEILERLAGLRDQIAGTEGKTWVEHKVQKLTLNTQEKVMAFYEEARAEITEKYRAAVARLQELAAADGVTDLQKYDLPYYEKRFIQQSCDIDAIPFTYESTMEGLSGLAESLLGVRLEEVQGAPAWADGVRTYTVRNVSSGATSDEVLGTIIVDPYSRAGKRSNAAAYGTRYGLTRPTPDGGEETVQLPIASVVANLAGPDSDGRPARMTLREVQTVAHEVFGHALAVVLGRARGPEFSGDKLPLDISEIFSQASERIMDDPAVLLQLSSSSDIPPDVRDQFLNNFYEARQTSSALNSMRMLEFMTFDLGLHAKRQTLAETREEVAALSAPVGNDGTMIRILVHMANDYAGRYGSTYVFCDTYAKGVAERLRANAYQHEQVGASLRAILERGGRTGAPERLFDFALAQMRANNAARPAGNSAVNSDGDVTP